VRKLESSPPSLSPRIQHLQIPVQINSFTQSNIPSILAPYHLDGFHDDPCSSNLNPSHSLPCLPWLSPPALPPFTFEFRWSFLIIATPCEQIESHAFLEVLIPPIPVLASPGFFAMIRCSLSVLRSQPTPPNTCPNSSEPFPKTPNQYCVTNGKVYMSRIHLFFLSNVQPQLRSASATIESSFKFSYICSLDVLSFSRFSGEVLRPSLGMIRHLHAPIQDESPLYVTNSDV
jgi:hypothetical protein